MARVMYEIEAKHRTEEDEWHVCGESTTSLRGARSLKMGLDADFGGVWRYRIVKVVREVLK